MSSGKVVAIAIARMGSSRVPGKVMRELRGQSIIRWVLHALWMAQGIDEIVLATTTDPRDDVIAEHYQNIDRHWLHSTPIHLFRGSEADVLDRFYQAAKLHNTDYCVRVTCDCPFLDPDVISEVIKLRELRNVAYASNVDPPTYPDGLDAECFSFAALEAAHLEATRPTDRDCVTQFILRNRHRFPAANLTCSLPGLQAERWVLDTEDDWRFCTELCKYVIPGSSYVTILDVLQKHPKIRKLNNKSRGALRNERFYEALGREELPQRHFPISAKLHRQAMEIIPFGAQTFSKSYLQFPAGRSPLLVSHGDGGRIFDVDGNDYVDLVGALLPVILGYRDCDVDDAVRRQLDSGISLSLATELEYQLAQRLWRLIPCAEMVKFGKSGTDVTTAAVRLARAYTGRDHILVGGYHGWADWSLACGERHLGIPDQIKRLSHWLPVPVFFDKDPGTCLTDRTKEGTAAIIVEPDTDPEYLQHLREVCTKWGIVLIFDEIITGFRFGLGGAQELYGVTPDLACFGKSMANGMPISALVGRHEIMRKMEPPDNIFYSGTFFGETLSIAAAIATIDKLERLDVAGRLLKTGIKLEYEILKLKQKYDIGNAVELYGHYPLLRLKFNNDRIRTLFMQEMAQGGVLIIASNNLSFAHHAPELQRIVTAYERAFAAIADAIKHNTLEEVVPQPVVTVPVRAVS